MAIRRISFLLGLGLSMTALGAVSATPASAEGGRNPDLFEHLSSAGSSCVGADAVHDLTYTTSSGALTSLGQLMPDTTLRIGFTVASDCNDVQVGAASYVTPGGRLVSQQSATFAAGSTGTVTVTVPACAFEVDVFTGAVNATPASYGTRRIDSVTAGTKVCDVTAQTPAHASDAATPAAAIPTTSTTTTPVVTVQPSAETRNETQNRASVEATASVTTTTAPVVVTGSPASLARTGFRTGLLSVFGAILLLTGIGIERFVRRRKTNH